MAEKVTVVVVTWAPRRIWKAPSSAWRERRIASLNWRSGTRFPVRK